MGRLGGCGIARKLPNYGRSTEFDIHTVVPRENPCYSQPNFKKKERKTGVGVEKDSAYSRRADWKGINRSGTQRDPRLSSSFILKHSSHFIQSVRYIDPPKSVNRQPCGKAPITYCEPPKRKGKQIKRKEQTH
ncbi:uncharacterized protein PGTG_03960 [Puccinia graminis f. sp. tritici CRL 75-36-700-3]|uniref:Uncharacterized protein n=1 Tax=Puccinia graminis f. sp. tritici (strain CRL 75-36-700-3 / race SCCL) TaxID=418459 RepID=E3K129_PUCGT|nr:uncharacterized protein PGTG_03960 [Puccinia graminis f. sp. tritici CRL 75-36-700-3]EFP78004.2 hypothetical protein PGTG_03960 [Puccinia graminis f. sp. tritici CRL 75-36-700-3]